MFETLEEVRRDVAARLRDAAADRKAPMHVPVVVTADADARIMVLRDFDADAWSLRFHTDARAPKTAVIDGDPRMGVLLYDKPAKVQIRLRGTGAVLRDGAEADAAWASSDNFARRCYLGEAPGAVSDSATSGLPENVRGIEPSDMQLVPARPNFAILKIAVTAIDWFSLAHTGHSRASFERAHPDGEWQGRWLAP